MDLKDLIGLELSKARQVLTDLGYNNIEVKLNSKKDGLSDSLVVCAVREDDSKIVLICGEFFLNLKEK